MEMHLVHVSPGGDLAVVGVMLDVGPPNAAFGPVFDHLPSEVGEEAEISRAQLDAFTELVDGNVRPIEALGDRTLTELTDE